MKLYFAISFQYVTFAGIKYIHINRVSHSWDAYKKILWQK